MITWAAEDICFNLRTAGVAYRDGCVLFQRVIGLDLWFLPGGRVEFMESAAQALEREIEEELGVRAEVDRLLWVVENFFAMDGRRYHELGLYFAISLPTTLPMDGEFPAYEPNVELFMRWLPMSEIPRLHVVPKFLKEALVNPPATPQHIVHSELDD